MQITTTYEPKNQLEWKKWLTKNHKTQKEIWVVFFKKSSGKQILTYQNILDEALCFGWIDGIEKSIDSERFALRFTPRAPKSRWSEKNFKRYNELLDEGKIMEAGKKAFSQKAHVYGSMSNKKGAIEWHISHKMPKNPTFEQRLEWHKEHLKFCSCRPVPASMTKYF